MGIVKDMVGYRFNGCKVLKRNGVNKDNRAIWVCVCKCGNIFQATGKSIRNGHVKSCGCYRKKVTGKQGRKNKTHGDTNTRLYNIYRGMKQRCYYTNAQNYEKYGDKGIKICEEWLEDFSNFKRWSLKNGYGENLSIDRIDNNGNYEPDNCRWVDAKTQTRNRSITKRAIFQGELLTLGEISEITGMSFSKVHYMYKQGMNFDEVKRTIKQADIKG
ncbi:hypothetical protein [Staphylococcus gallinarum]|uniref:hypothetical protein n=1 Tax=Staphylococcus gallinarum TaxID=1293 RepID=UPI000D1C82C0|nr:hypothetical protein [Staphylococcus gallinarum]PTE79287.1 hypothetical protein BUY96_02375 [Staphylococcus gallinarum]